MKKLSEAEKLKRKQERADERFYVSMGSIMQSANFCYERTGSEGLHNSGMDERIKRAKEQNKKDGGTLWK